MSAVFFLSGIFSVFAPLPLLLLAAYSRRRWAWMAAATNGALVCTLGGWVSFRIYLALVLALSLALPEFLRARRSLERVVLMTLGTMLAVGVGVVAFHAFRYHLNPVVDIRDQMSHMIDYILSSVSPEVKTGWLAGMDVEEWKVGFLHEIPSAIGIFSLVLVWSNLVLILRLNPKNLRARLGISPDYFRNWKAPEYLLWPTVLAGFLVVFNFGWPSEISLNVFKLFMAVYALQGLSILSFVFDAWNVRGFLRNLAFGVAVLLMLPLVLSLGFFDLWFDFRAKLRQS